MLLLLLFLPGAVAQSESVSAWHASGSEFDPHVRHILSWRLGHENISTSILLRPLIQEEQLSVKPRLHDTTLLYIYHERYIMIYRVAPNLVTYIFFFFFFGVSVNSILNRECPIPYSLKDTTFYLFLSLANES